MSLGEVTRSHHSYGMSLDEVPGDERANIFLTPFFSDVKSFFSHMCCLKAPVIGRQTCFSERIQTMTLMWKPEVPVPNGGDMKITRGTSILKTDSLMLIEEKFAARIYLNKDARWTST